MTRSEFRERVERWRALPEAEKTTRRRRAVVDQAIGSMAMEDEPVSAAWESSARRRLPAGFAQ
ncbi:MAG TPA: hypothetical protein VIW24_17255 [Aldersonia sp.]